MEYKFFKALENSSLKDYEALFLKCFGSTKLTTDYLDWLYLQNPDGIVIGVDAFCNDRLVAHYSVIPRKYRYEDISYLGALSVNTATDPSHQGKGLFSKLASMTYEIAKSKGVNFVTGVANKNSIGGFVKKLEFQNLGNVELQLGNHRRLCDDKINCLQTDRQEKWIDWRLKNPSSTYFCTKSKSFYSLSSIKNGVEFNLLCSASKYENLQSLPGYRSLVPALTPKFQFNAPNSIIKVPNFIKPSPWYVIWKSLVSDQEIENLKNYLVIFGIDMDTF
jgi:hypothetical protein